MFSYYGAKFRLSKRYPAPQYSTIIEPFAGSAQYAVRHADAAERVILIEKDPTLVELWHRLLAMTPEEVRAIPPLPKGARTSDYLYYLPSGNQGLGVYKDFQVTERMAKSFAGMIKRVAESVEKCRHFEVIEGDYRDAPNIEATWFIDPPYQVTDHTKRGGKGYKFGTDLIDYEELAVWCLGRKGQLIVCEQEGADWLPWTDSVAAQTGSNAKYKEVWLHIENNSSTRELAA